MQPTRIVVIEDSDSDMMLLRLALDQQQEDYELEILKNGEEAMRFVQDHRKGVREPEPCAILLDLHLPIYDGIEILGAISQSAGAGACSCRGGKPSGVPWPRKRGQEFGSDV
jgi:CheY-like chemotaxis protein